MDPHLARGAVGDRPAELEPAARELGASQLSGRNRRDHRRCDRRPRALQRILLRPGERRRADTARTRERFADGLAQRCVCERTDHATSGWTASGRSTSTARQPAARPNRARPCPPAWWAYGRPFAECENDDESRGSSCRTGSQREAPEETPGQIVLVALALETRPAHPSNNDDVRSRAVRASTPFVRATIPSCVAMSVRYTLRCSTGRFPERQTSMVAARQLLRLTAVIP
jgi:hypothetical protein